jgi:hypothetical protein
MDTVPFRWRPKISGKCDSCKRFILTGAGDAGTWISDPDDLMHPFHPAHSNRFIVLCDNCVIKHKCQTRSSVETLCPDADAVDK